MLSPLLCLIQVGSPDTLSIGSVQRSPRPGVTVDSSRYRPPQLRIRTGQGTALIWLLRATDSCFVAAVIPDSTPYWGDDFVLSKNVGGDFQWYFRRALDSSVPQPARRYAGFG